MNRSIHIDRELVQRLKAGDTRAFDALYKKYSRRLLGYVYYLLKSKEDSENVVQEVFVKLWENRERIRNCESVYSYIFTIAHHTSISLIREKLKDIKFKEYLLSIQEFSVEDSVDAGLEYAELQKVTDKVIANLTDRQREIYLMHRENELTYREIAEKLNISVNTVENHMANALKIIRNQLKKTSPLATLFMCLFI